MGDTGLELNSQKSSQPFDNKEVKDTTCPAPKHKTVQNQVQILQKHSDLEQIISAWLELPEHIKAAIKALTQTHIKEIKK